MHVRNKLNVKQMPGLTKAGVYSDGGGLYLRVRPTGTRSWLFICMIRGKRRELGLGSVLDVSLSEARQKAAEARADLLAGRDPLAARRQAVIVEVPKLTFGEMAQSLISDITEGFRNEKHRKQWSSTIDRYAAPILDTPVDAVTTDDMLALLKPIWMEKQETARRVRGRIERVLDAAKVKGLRSGENPARYKGHLELLLPRQSKAEAKHHAALPFDKLPAFMVKLKKRAAMAARALEFALLTAARTGEILGATWGEVDFDKALWTIPADRMKANATHEVPLSDSALALLDKIKPDHAQDSHSIFLAPRGGQMSNMAMAQLLKRMEYTDITVHGFRSTFRDWAGERSGFAREDIEMALAHTIQSKTERAYRRGRSLDKRRKLMIEWDRFCNESV